MIRKLIWTKGLPASGKSTWALEEQKRLREEGIPCVIVCKDDIRAELEKTGWTWSHENEKQVLSIRDAHISDAFRAVEECVVISADTNLGKHESQLRRIANRHKADFELKDFTNVPLETCIERDSKREKPVGEQVIRGMYEKYVWKGETTKYVATTSKPLACICDLDGTIALHNGNRSPFDYSLVEKDTLNIPVADIIKRYAKDGVQIVYCSGREDWCRPHTERWMVAHELPTGPLFMRASKDHRNDAIVKRELFDKHIREQYNILFVLDDRDRVVKMWRELGLTCLQVAEGNF